MTAEVMLGRRCRTASKIFRECGENKARIHERKGRERKRNDRNEMKGMK